MNTTHIGPPRTARLVARPKPLSALCWGLVFFVFGQAALGLILERWWIKPRDPEFVARLQHLCRLREEHPEQALILALGSSRVVYGLDPAALSSQLTWQHRECQVFNFAQLGAGPRTSLRTIRRVLASGIRPDSIILEYWPPGWNAEGPMATNAAEADMACLSWKELRTSKVPLVNRTASTGAWWGSRLLPYGWWRATLLSCWCPNWLPYSARKDGIWNSMSDHGFVRFTLVDDPDGFHHKTLVSVFSESYEDYRASAEAYAATRRVLDLCRRHGIPVILLRLPEARCFRSLYPRSVVQETDAYVAELAQCYGAAVVDARDWVADEQMPDGLHLTPAAAVEFTRRLERETLGMSGE
jgi:hypothetical protein